MMWRLLRALWRSSGLAGDRKLGLGKYDSVKVDHRDMVSGAYKKHLGGGSEAWEQRGAFQLRVMQQIGLEPNSKLLDVGCGPGRASTHLISYLNPGNYFGMDYNEDFVDVARSVTAARGLSDKQAQFAVVHDFDLNRFNSAFDFGLVFSVLNHCSEPQRELFFRRIPPTMKRGARILISHAAWFEPSYIDHTGLEFSASFGPDDFDATEFGWKKLTGLFPMIQLTRV